MPRSLEASHYPNLNTDPWQMTVSFGLPVRWGQLEALAVASSCVSEWTTPRRDGISKNDGPALAWSAHMARADRRPMMAFQSEIVSGTNTTGLLVCNLRSD